MPRISIYVLLIINENNLKYFIITDEQIKDEGEEEHIEPEHEIEPDEEEIETVKPKKIPNQFNFCERAALTYTNPLRVSLCRLKLNEMSFAYSIDFLLIFQEMNTQTVPPPISTFNTHVFQWTIFDKYQACIFTQN